MGLGKISKFFQKIFFPFSGPPMKGNDPPTSILSEFIWNAHVWRRKMPFRTSFYLDLTLTYDVLNVMLGYMKHVKS